MEALARRMAELERMIRDLMTRELPMRHMVGCFVIQTVSQSIPSGSLTPLVFDTEIFDTGNCWSSSQPSRLYIPQSGYYIAGGGWSRNEANNPNSSRHMVLVGLYDSGYNLIRYISASEVHTIPSKFARASVSSGPFFAMAGQIVSILAYQDSGSTVYTYPSSITNAHHHVNGWLLRVG